MKEVRQGTIAIEEIRFEIADGDQNAFLKDPEKLLAGLVKAAGETVNSVVIDPTELDAIKKKGARGVVRVVYMLSMRRSSATSYRRGTTNPIA